MQDAPVAATAEHDEREHGLEQTHGAREAVEAAERVAERPATEGEVGERGRDVEQALDDRRRGHVDDDEVGDGAKRRMFSERVAHDGVSRQADQEEDGQRREKRNPESAIFFGKRRHVFGACS